jgi:magnesium transporter
MIRMLAVDQQGQIQKGASLEQLDLSNYRWYWVDFDQPTKEETPLLETYFHFHPLAIEDCLNFLQRPKLDLYTDYTFLVLHALDHRLQPKEVNLFVGDRFVVSFHKSEVREIDQAFDRLAQDPHARDGDANRVAHHIMDQLVDGYFPLVSDLDDQLSQIDDLPRGTSSPNLMNRLFQLRGQLLKLHHTVISMRDLSYRILQSERFNQSKENKAYYKDIYDHLEKLAHILQMNREITADIRDSYLSINSYRMNAIMMTLTMITTIFMPLTLIAGIYGMNFQYMPELQWRYGYFAVLGIMAFIGTAMFAWFKHKGWFDGQ